MSSSASPAAPQPLHHPWLSGASPSTRPAVVLLCASLLALALGWSFGPERAELFRGLGVVLAGAAAAAVASRTPSRVGRALAGTGSGLIAAWVILDAVSLRLPLSYEHHLLVEAILAFGPAVAVTCLVAGVERARAELAGADGVLPLPLRWGGPLAFLVGGVVRVAEVWLLMGHPGTAETLHHALRFDAAFTVWALSAFALAGALAYVAYASHHDGRRRLPVRRVAFTAVAALLLFSFVGYDVGMAAAIAADPPKDLSIGMHTSRVDDVDPDLVDFVHLEVSWSQVEQQEGELNWSRYDAAFDLAEAKGLGVYLLAGTYPPPWLSEKYPQAVMVDQWGRPFTWLDVAPNEPRDRVWDMSFAHPDVVRAKQAFLTKVVERYADRPGVIAVSIQNEPAWPADWNLFRYASYDAWTRYAFHRDVVDRYGDLEALNHALGTVYTSWADVTAPTSPFDPLWDEWMRFREDLLLAFVTGQVETVRDLTDRPVTVKIAAHSFTKFAQGQSGLSDRVMRGMANVSDVVSIDIYPANLGALERDLRYFHHLANGKPLVVAEFNLLFGANGPTGGAQLLAALDLMDQYATHVGIFTASEHYLYGLGALPQSPSLVALELLRTDPLDPAFHGHLARLMVEDLLAVQNLYAMYELGSAAAGLPVIPAPVLLLLVAPIPTPSVRADRAVTATRAAALVGAAGMGVFLLI